MERQEFAEIVGNRLQEITSSEHTYVGLGGGAKSLKTESVDLIFDRGRFQIENRFTVDGGHAYWLPGSNGAMEVLEVLVGHQVFEAFSTDTEILLRFEGGNELRISLRDEDFIGPEAASYLPNDGLIIVFN